METSFSQCVPLIPALHNLQAQTIVIEGNKVDIEEYNPSFMTGLSPFCCLLLEGRKDL